ncbi:MFS transporter [Amycolatopsis sp. Poz14]|nr:MFS transporter [Amycolatopsis sp. Poz14]
MDRLTAITRSHRIWVWLLGYLFVFDLVDLNTFAYSAPALRGEWGLSVGAVGVITSAGFFGMFVGGVTGGRIADRLGRRPVIIGAGLLYSLFSLVSAISPNAEVLGISRVLTGFALQAMTGVLLVYVSEMFPLAKRGRYQALMSATGLAGIPIAATVSRLIIPLGHGSWRWIFVIGAGGALGALAAIRLLPESARWSAARARFGGADRVVSRLESEARAAGVELAEPVLVSTRIEKTRFRNLLEAKYIKRTVVASVMMIFYILGAYGFLSWVPTLLNAHGMSVTQSLTFSLVLSIAAVPGALMAWPVIDRWERKNLMAFLSVTIAVCMIVFGFFANTVTILVFGFLITLLLEAMTPIAYTYLPEIFPTQLRGLGSGIANSMGRLAGVAGSFLVPAIFAGLGFTGVFSYLAVTMVLVAVTLGFFGERTTRRRLEELSADQSRTAVATGD